MHIKSFSRCQSHHNLANYITGERKATEALHILIQQPPKVLLLGEVGVGKRSLVRALFGRDVLQGKSTVNWQRVGNEYWQMDVKILEDLERAQQLVERPTKRDVADVVLFVVHAKELDLRLKRQTHILSILGDHLSVIAKKQIPLIVVLNQVDKLYPQNEISSTKFSSQKYNAINEATNLLKALVPEAVGVIPTVSVFNEKTDLRYNIDLLVLALFSTLPFNIQAAILKTTIRKHIKQATDTQTKVAT